MTLAHPTGRVFVALAAMLIVGLGMHALLSTAICLRGDLILASVGPTRARQYYDRARWFDPGNIVAVDRIAFMTLLRPLPDAIATILKDPIVQHSTDSGILLDRALLEERSRRFARAANDFKILAHRLQNSRYMLFAALLERGRRPTPVVRTDLEAALKLDPRNGLALRALSRLK